MNAIRTAYVIPLVLLSACGVRQAAQVSDLQAAPPAAEAAQPAEPPLNFAPAQSREPRALSLPSGTTLRVRLEETIDTRRNRAGDRFFATLVDPVVENGTRVIPRGTRCEGHLTESKPSGRFKGRAVLGLSLDSFELNGRNYDITTTRVARASGGHKKRNWIFIGGGSGFGAAVGAIAAGPAGALIGAGSGAAAGTAGAAFTGKKNVRLPVETQLSFVLRSPVSLGAD